MSTPERITLTRVLEPKAASELVGKWVDTQTPTHTRPFIATDAETGATILAYLPVEGIADLRRAILSVRIATPGPTQARASGILNASRNFGYQPRRPVYMREGCAASGLNRDSPGVETVLAAWATRLSGMLEMIDPGIAAQNRAELEIVKPEWKLGESNLWTSGVINKSSKLPYHRDGFNFPTWSAMPVIRRGMNGGYLHIPEYDVVLPCRDGYAVFFPGYQLVHGVTPWSPQPPTGTGTRSCTTR